MLKLHVMFLTNPADGFLQASLDVDKTCLFNLKALLLVPAGVIQSVPHAVMSWHA